MDGAAVNASEYYREEDIAALIRTLDREEDHHIFAEDVLKTYPYLEESYTKVCPQRCDLATAAKRAREGAYSHDVRLNALRVDIALMVSNCVAYNGPTSAYAETAAKFERFAFDQIDRFVIEHNNGRRPSRLRLPAASQEQPQQRHHASNEQGKKGSAPDRGATATAFVVPTTREVVQLVESFNRREDGGAFSVDVAEAYPDLRESYQKMCPHPMNLVMMRQRAKEGHYTANPTAPPLFGPSVAASFTRLREDVELLVRNCVTFNAKVDSWVKLAHSFQAFAHRRIDDFVLQHAASLRGTQTGAQSYPNGTINSTSTAAATVTEAAPAPALSSTASNANISGSNAGGKRDGRKRERAEERGGGSSSTATTCISALSVTAPPPVKVVGEVAPQVCPTPLQPSLVIPPRLRRRLALEHLQHMQLPLRRVGVSVPLAELYPALPKLLKAGATAAPLAEAPEGKPGEETPLPSSSPSSTQLITIDASSSAGHVLQLLRQSIEEFFCEQRRRPDFTDAFAFSQREEHLYRSVLQVIAEQFENTVQHLLLYERESAELAEWTALKALQKVAEDTADQAAPRLADHLHYLYLVRFLAQWPQLACLCCTSSTPPVLGGGPAATSGAGSGSAGAATTAAQGSLRISRDQLKAMAQVALITQELLNFVEKVDERISGV
ncbi:hypothetical protein ABL78_5281 [Leptomonas seymouri]|uniref:Bromo domain-containing protein n=1 Tax=Leptomonas seymouri TaxID=5684 RepID=A0A0N1I3P5_LEPSE|nr:hypothetical protein ABL78_5281 [Leptomonas seymouri]|eukprot:KPI85660.1 hypothetical protein ABL78_5281 [Leptomonas seymouri]